MRANKQSPYGSPADSMTLSHVLTALCMIPFLVIAPPSLNQSGVLALLFMGVCQVGLASMLFSYGIIKVPAVSAMLLSSIEPVLNPLWVLLVTGAKPSSGALAGGAVIICAALTASLRFSRAPSARK
jgi:drug/metabolite transporter (DMT)-like permease